MRKECEKCRSSLSSRLSGFGWDFDFLWIYVNEFSSQDRENIIRIDERGLRIRESEWSLVENGRSIISFSSPALLSQSNRTLPPKLRIEIELVLVDKVNSFKVRLYRYFYRFRQIV